jgi:hypothetical protein
MEPEGSLPHSQVPANCPCLETGQSSPCPTSHFLKFHLNIVLSSTPGSPKWSLSLMFPHQKPDTCNMPCPTHFSRFCHPSNIWWGVQIIKLQWPLRTIHDSPSLTNFTLLTADTILWFTKILCSVDDFRLIFIVTVTGQNNHIDFSDHSNIMVT